MQLKDYAEKLGLKPTDRSLGASIIHACSFWATLDEKYFITDYDLYYFCDENIKDPNILRGQGIVYVIEMKTGRHITISEEILLDTEYFWRMLEEVFKK